MDKHLVHLKIEIEQAKTDLEQLTATLFERDRQIRVLTATVGQENAKAEQLTEALSKREKQVTELCTAVDQKNIEVEQPAMALPAKEHPRQTSRRRLALPRSALKSQILLLNTARSK